MIFSNTKKLVFFGLTADFRVGTGKFKVSQEHLLVLLRIFFFNESISKGHRNQIKSSPTDQNVDPLSHKINVILNYNST